MSGAVEIADYSEQESIQRFLTFRILRVHSKLNAQAARILRTECGLTLTQWRVLAFIGTRGSATLTVIHKITQIDKGQLSRVINQMLEEGFLTGEENQDDLRMQNLKLSDRGQAILVRMLPVMSKRQQILLDALDPGEREAIYTILDKLEIAAEAELIK